MSNASISVRALKNVLPKLPSFFAVLLRGDTGIGKSDIVRQCAEALKLEVVDRRLSQMTEGDLLGLPSTTDGRTRWNPPDWFVDCCERPRLLFLDELNRATQEVQQGAFQLVLDRELNGRKLHPDTRVYAAINVGSKFQVNDMDAALLRRFFVADLCPTTDDWLDYARASGHRMEITDFVGAHPQWLAANDKASPGDVVPTPASWSRLDAALRHAGNPDPSDELYFALARGLLGSETATTFVQFVRNNFKPITADEIFEKYAPASCDESVEKATDVRKRVMAMPADRWPELLDRVYKHVRKWNELPKIERTDAKGKKVTDDKIAGTSLKLFFRDMPIEHRLEAWGYICANGSREAPAGHDMEKWIKSYHPHVVEVVVTETFGVPVGKAGINVEPKFPAVLQQKLNGGK